ncbi:SLATT domain-containing protein [Vibrio parahaemolyticus]|uniref:SLATT domain-containing protein n=1 Tax=Vibrio parahaemolyticus TaxID=670 RepID=UPI001869994C|nr:SLATT domain-containing protein [Vibrio parahaemolyticus]ELB2095445.1 SLATT domain-containing protein [Vibrio parahaemolyticus]ELB2127435.1 SLATT domain-containing protein [Vibrio parahaemolyticus]MBE4309505.1 SLATT domain-containing protein [Vibrio parahaemolyticus]MDF5668134.1 SLATT domain-containing protein [Vibrio parahaemolyticus]
MSIKKYLRYMLLRLCTKKKKVKTPPKYTQKGFDAQLNYNLWSSSRSRFTASKRLEIKNKLSGQTVSFASAYLILLSLIQVFIQEQHLSQLVTYINISLAIIILAISQIESSSNYSLRAHKFHDCGLELNTLYKRLRRLKNEYQVSEGKEKDDDFWKAVGEIDNEYDLILRRHDNHDRLDYEMFKASYPKYEDHSVSGWFIFKTKSKYYIQTKFLYHFLIYVPPLFLTYFAFYILGYEKVFDPIVALVNRLL